MLVDIENLRIAFENNGKQFEAVRGVSFKLEARQKLAIVGESGSGKSITARALMRLLPPQAQVTADRMLFDGIDILSQSEREMRKLRGGRAGFILQDPKYSLNPVKTIGNQIAEAWLTHNKGSKKEARAATLNLLEQVMIRDPQLVLNAYPHEISGGMGQRAMIAMMLAPNPSLLIADEPTSALDASVQAEVLRLIDELVDTHDMGLLLISHDLPLVSNFCDKVSVMYMGQIVEELAAKDLAQAAHPYTKGLLNCLPSLDHPRDDLPVLTRDPQWLEEQAQ